MVFCNCSIGPSYFESGSSDHVFKVFSSVCPHTSANLTDTHVVIKHKEFTDEVLRLHIEAEGSISGTDLNIKGVRGIVFTVTDTDGHNAILTDHRQILNLIDVDHLNDVLEIVLKVELNLGTRQVGCLSRGLDAQGQRRSNVLLRPEVMVR